MADNKILHHIHARVEEILQRVPLPEHAIKHRHCRARSYHVTFGQNDRDGEIVEFDRHCIDGGICWCYLTRDAFENDTVLDKWIDSEKKRREVEEYDIKRRRYELYLELKSEFKGLDA